MTLTPVNDEPVFAGRASDRLAAFATVGLFGATAIVAQVLLLRECLIVVAGNELFLALFFGCWFLGIAAGAAIGSIWKPRPARMAVWVPFFLLLQVSLLPVLMTAIRALRWRWGIEAHTLIPFPDLLKIGLIHLCPFSFLTGLTFPMLCRLIVALRGVRERSIGAVYAVESLGSLVGGVVASFIFILLLKPLTGAWLLGLLTAANLVGFSARAGGRWGRVSGAVSVVFAFGFAAVLFTPLRPAVEDWSASFRHRAYGAQFEWLEERYSPYQHLALVRLGDQYSLLSNGQFIATFPEPYATSQTVHLLMSQPPNPRRVLLIGGQPGYLPALLKYPGLAVDYVEIDPEVLRIVRPYVGEPVQQAMDDPRVGIYYEDARRFVRTGGPGTAKGALRYDAILCAAPDPSTAALNRFYTYDFFREAKQLLANGGVFVSTIGSGVNYFSEALLNYVGSVYAALGLVFRDVLATPGGEAVLFATVAEGLLTADVGQLIARFDARGIRNPGFSPLYFFTAYEQAALQRTNRILRNSLGKVRPNLDVEPISYLHHLRLWDYYSGETSQHFFDIVERYRWQWVVWVVALVFAVRLIAFRWWPMRSAQARYRHSLLVLFLAGTSGMVASVMLQLLYQNFFGSLYREVGLLVALFMAGLTLGGIGGNRWGGNTVQSLTGRCAVAALLFALFFLFLEFAVGARTLGWPLGRVFEWRGFFFLATVTAGLLTGVLFPLTGRLAVVSGRDPGHTGGVLECTDHIGACIGAFLVGIVLVPVSGMIATLKVFRVILFFAGVSLALSALHPHTERSMDDSVGS